MSAITICDSCGERVEAPAFVVQATVIRVRDKRTIAIRSDACSRGCALALLAKFANGKDALDELGAET
jgi:hypothetical protein